MDEIEVRTVLEAVERWATRRTDGGVPAAAVSRVRA
jgi:hypothetical protein